MYRVLNNNQTCRLLRDFLRDPSKVEDRQVKALEEFFPAKVQAGEENPNFYALKLFRELKDRVDRRLLAEKLGTDEYALSLILSSPSLEVLFPVSNGKEAFMVKALVIPLESDEVLSVEDVPRTALETIRKLAGKGFLLSFSHGFDLKSTSFMLSVYSALEFGSRAESFAFTGTLSEEGSVGEVSHLDLKLKKAKEEKVPLIFPHTCMRSTEDLRRFIDDLVIPVAVLPSKGEGIPPEAFESLFAFGKEYLEKVFHIEEGLFYTEEFNGTKRSFEDFVKWMEALTGRLSDLRGKGISFRVALTSKLLVMSFLAGVKLSKARAVTDFYEYRNEKGYVRAVSLRDDAHRKCGGSSLVEVERTEEDIKQVIVSTREIHREEKALIIRVPSGEDLRRNLERVACEASEIIRSESFEHADLKLNVSNSLSFALGYMLEDYKCLTLHHYSDGNYVPVYTVGGGTKGPLILLNAFSLNMLKDRPAYVEVKDIDPYTARRLVRERGFVSYISHRSTAEVLSEILDEEVPFRRENVILPNLSTVLVFQLKVRPPEGGVFSQEEVKKIVGEGRFSFHLVRVYY